MKLLETIPDEHVVSFMMETLSNGSFGLHTSNGQSSRVSKLKNGVPPGSVLAPLLFNPAILLSKQRRGASLETSCLHT